MSAAIRFWRAEHANFGQLLDLLESKLAAFCTGEAPEYDLMLDIVRYLRNFPDRLHHPREDIAFARLVRHDPGFAPQIARLLQEHRAIAVAGTQLHRLLTGAVAGELIPRERIEAAAATYLVYYRHHIAAEELNIIPKALELLTPSDWAEVAGAVAPSIDPLFGANADAGYRELRRQIALESA